jgi:hypothetical protein
MRRSLIEPGIAAQVADYRDAVKGMVPATRAFMTKFVTRIRHVPPKAKPTNR